MSIVFICMCIFDWYVFSIYTFGSALFSHSSTAALLRAFSRHISRILHPLVPGTLFLASSVRSRGARRNERKRCIASRQEALSPLRLSI